MVCTSFAGISLDLEIAPLDIAETYQLLENGRDCEGPFARLINIVNRGYGMPECDTVNFPSLLCLRPSRYGREHETSDEVSPPHLGFPEGILDLG
jgi:hypothetical protein